MKFSVREKFIKAYREAIMANQNDDIDYDKIETLLLKPGQIYEWPTNGTVAKSNVEKRLEKLENVLKTLGINLEDE